MNNVFQIDQECYLIYLEEFSAKHNAFIRIGNSPVLDEFKNQLRYVTLISGLNPGNPSYESEILKSHKEFVIIGLKKDLNNYKSFIKSKGIDDKKVQCIYVEEANEAKNHNKSEKDFIEIIKNDNKLRYHSFASFYSDGNIRVFNKREIYFDLIDKLNQSKSINFEIKNSKNIYKNFYEQSYKKDGIITCHNSIFIFSDNQFACIANDQKWVKDAIRVGIDPSEIQCLFLNTGIEPDQSWFKVISEKSKNESKMNIVFQKEDEMQGWIYLFSNEFIKPVHSKEEADKYELNKIKLMFKNDIINVIYGKYKFFITLDKKDASKYQTITGSINNEKFKITIDGFDHEAFTLYSKNPMIFSDSLAGINYIKTFWDAIQDKAKDKFEGEIKTADQDYDISYKPKIDANEFYQLLFLETVRRLNIDGNTEAKEDVFKYYKSALSQFDGNVLNINKILIEQHIGINKKIKKICIRDVFINNNFINVKDEINPLLKFQNEHEASEWSDNLNNYRNNHKKNINIKSLDDKIIKRFNDILESKKFHKTEQDRLTRFLQEKKITEKRKENIEKKDEINKIYNTSASTRYITTKEQEALTDASANDVKKPIKKNKKNLIPILLPLLIIFFILIMLLGAGYLVYTNRIKLPDNLSWFFNRNKSSSASSTDTSGPSQSEYFSSRNNLNNSSITSNYYKFSMTIPDLINLVNEIALKNGYHRMAPEYLKESLKGKDPDWIYPGNTFNMPDDTKITVVSGNTLWGICEKYLNIEINKHEIIIRDLILKTKTKDITVDKAKEGLTAIKNETHSEMMRDIISVLLTLPNFNEWEPYLEEKTK